MSLNTAKLSPEALQGLFNDFVYLIPENSSDLVIKKSSDLPSVPSIPKINPDSIETIKEEPKKIKEIKKEDTINLKELKKEIFTSKISKKAIIYIKEEDAENELKTFLFKILQAVKLAESDIHLIVQSSKHDIDISSSTKDFTASKILSFGINFISDYKAELNKECAYSPEIKLFHTYGLKELISDTDKKKVLWSNLQLIFPAK